MKSLKRPIFYWYMQIYSDYENLILIYEKGYHLGDFYSFADI